MEKYFKLTPAGDLVSRNITTSSNEKKFLEYFHISNEEVLSLSLLELLYLKNHLENDIQTPYNREQWELDLQKYIQRGWIRPLTQILEDVIQDDLNLQQQFKNFALSHQKETVKEENKESEQNKKSTDNIEEQSKRDQKELLEKSLEKRIEPIVFQISDTEKQDSFDKFKKMFFS